MNSWDEQARQRMTKLPPPGKNKWADRYAVDVGHLLGRIAELESPSNRAMPQSTQGPDHELQPAEPALDLLESHGRRPMSLRDRLVRFIDRDPHRPYTGSWD